MLSPDLRSGSGIIAKISAGRPRASSASMLESLSPCLRTAAHAGYLGHRGLVREDEGLYFVKDKSSCHSSYY